MLAGWEQLGDCATSLLTRLGLLECTFSDDGNFKALIMLRGLAMFSVPLKEGDFALCANEYGGNGYGVMQRRTSGDAESVTEVVS